jgi:uncharacterized protein
VTVVLDSSALITLARIGRLDLLRQIAGEVHVPNAVFEEVAQRGAGRPGSVEIAQADWVLRRRVRDLTFVDRPAELILRMLAHPGVLRSCF